MFYQAYVEILAKVSAAILAAMSGQSVERLKCLPGASAVNVFPLALVINYEQINDSTKQGHFVLGFSDLPMALTVASAISRQMGLGRLTELDAIAVDVLGEFMNTVVGRTISTWDRMGMPVAFGPPSPLQQAEIRPVPGYQSETYLLILDLPAGSITLRVTFSETTLSTPATARILVVEDSRLARRVISSTLSEVGFEVVEAVDGLEAIAMFQEFRPDLTVMDLVMPRLGGLEAMLSIRESEPEAKFLVLTSSDRTDEVVSAKTIGVCDYLLKPVKPPELLQAVTKALKEQAPGGGGNSLSDRAHDH
ncbi:MAG: response regulator [Deltaproteobacteria bacterium]|nr:response regulator [Deltaproteobacteria bacterium]